MQQRSEALPLLAVTTQSHAQQTTKHRPVVTTIILLLVLVTALAGFYGWQKQPIDTAFWNAVDATGQRLLLPYCQEHYLPQELDHFQANGGPGTFEQRYFVCDAFFDRSQARGAMFFYAGNEADVELYLNNTGLMWENARQFNALLVFAEHRYFGKSMPAGTKEIPGRMSFLSSTQALADYVRVIDHIKGERDLNVPVIAFGGSYGGMLAAWLRMKYPFVVDGAIASSAPVLAFLGETHGPPADTEAFLRIAMHDASPEAGAASQCIPNIQQATHVMLDHGQTLAGRQELAEVLHLCDASMLTTQEDISGLVNTALSAFVMMAQGNYPYPSSYMTGGNAMLPAYPVRAACAHLAKEFNDSTALLQAFRDAVGVWYNASHSETCYFPRTGPPPSAANHSLMDQTNLFGYLSCAELYLPFSSDGEHDFFPSMPLDLAQADAACMEQWGIHLRPYWAMLEYGGRRALASTSNIVFSNGAFDPWSGTGVLESVSDSVISVMLPTGAHHLDLFFSHPHDPPTVRAARDTERRHMGQWIAAFYDS